MQKMYSGRGWCTGVWSIFAILSVSLLLVCPSGRFFFVCLCAPFELSEASGERQNHTIRYLTVMCWLALVTMIVTRLARPEKCNRKWQWELQKNNLPWCLFISWRTFAFVFEAAREKKGKQRKSQHEESATFAGNSVCICAASSVRTKPTPNINSAPSLPTRKHIDEKRWKACTSQRRDQK